MSEDMQLNGHVGDGNAYKPCEPTEKPCEPFFTTRGPRRSDSIAGSHLFSFLSFVDLLGVNITVLEFLKEW